MKTTISIISLGMAIAAFHSASMAAEKGTIIKRADLPESIKAQSAKTTKHADGIPSCNVGRVKGDWGEVSSEDFEKAKDTNHPCIKSDDIYVCRAFGKLSIRCENPSK